MDIQSSIIKAFATFLLLSYVKLLNSTVDILLPVRTYDMHDKVVGWYVYYNASYKYFSKEHLPYAITAITIFLLFILSPLICFSFSSILQAAASDGWAFANLEVMHFKHSLTLSKVTTRTALNMELMIADGLLESTSLAES